MFSKTSPFGNSLPSRSLPTIQTNPDQSGVCDFPESGSVGIATSETGLIQTIPDPSAPNRTVGPLPLLLRTRKYFLPYQIQWLDDGSALRIMEKSRQVGLSYV